MDLLDHKKRGRSRGAYVISLEPQQIGTIAVVALAILALVFVLGILIGRAMTPRESTTPDSGLVPASAPVLSAGESAHPPAGLEELLVSGDTGPGYEPSLGGEDDGGEEEGGEETPPPSASATTTSAPAPRPTSSSTSTTTSVSTTTTTVEVEPRPGETPEVSPIAASGEGSLYAIQVESIPVGGSEEEAEARAAASVASLRERGFSGARYERAELEGMGVFYRVVALEGRFASADEARSEAERLKTEGRITAGFARPVGP